MEWFQRGPARTSPTRDYRASRRGWHGGELAVISGRVHGAGFHTRIDRRVGGLPRVVEAPLDATFCITPQYMKSIPGSGPGGTRTRVPATVLALKRPRYPTSPLVGQDVASGSTTELPALRGRRVPAPPDSTPVMAARPALPPDGGIMVPVSVHRPGMRAGDTRGRDRSRCTARVASHLIPGTA